MRKSWNIGDPLDSNDVMAYAKACLVRTGGRLVTIDIALSQRPLFVDFEINKARGLGIEGTCSPSV